MAAELVRERHQQRAADAGLDVLFGRILFPTGEFGGQARAKRIEHRHDRDLVVAHAQAFGHLARVEPRDVSRVGRRHHHAAHLVGAERVDRDGEHERRIDAAGQADDDARKAVLADVVAHPRDERGPGLPLDLGDGGDLAPKAAVGRQFNDASRFLEHRRTRRDTALGVDRERPAVEHDLVLAAHEVAVEQRHGSRARALGHALFALGELAEMKRRGVEHAQHLRTGRLGARGRLVEPGVLADREAETQAADLEHDRPVASVAPGGEVAPFVEHLVVRQARACSRSQPPAPLRAARPH